MKKILFFLSITALITACGSGDSKTTTTTADSSAATTATTTPSADSSKMATTSTAATVKDSVMQFKGGKVLISKGGAWSELTAAVTTTNGRKVNPDGEVVSKGGKKKKLEEGMMIDKDGQLMDKDGKPLDNTGWE
jgi:hypothetical protein